ncbi:MAG: choice-of-anchor L domain-containing protein [Myxococcota bacterium]|jgi:hypothetical protein|nr:choice-of-anchor L domain-containing protein [Myxococcota bacterium]
MLKISSMGVVALLLGGCPGPPPGMATDTQGTNFGTHANQTTDSGEPIEVDCGQCEGVGTTLEAAVCALDLCDGSTVVSVEHRVPVQLLPEYAVSDTMAVFSRFGTLSNDLVPRKNGNYVTLATGVALESKHDDAMDDGTIALFDPFEPSGQVRMRDVVELRVGLKAPAEARAIRFQYVFFSAEYDEYVGSLANDRFYAILEARSTNDGAPTIINFTPCRDPDTHVDFQGEGCPLTAGKCCYLGVNSALSECCWVDDCPNGAATTDISGTGYSCALDNASDSASRGSSTGWLTTSWPVQGGETVVLTFHVHDAVDAGADSQVLVDAVEFLRAPLTGTHATK